MFLQPEDIPTEAGVYIFRSKNTPLYIGKAANLKKRLSSYFRKNVGGKTRELLAEAIKLDWIETSSEIEAFLKEAELIKKYRPKYNYLLRDDKNYFYVGITKEAYPRIFITHQPYKNQNDKLKFKISYIGPFTSGAALKLVLKLLRKIFPYCVCKTPHKHLCLNVQIGRCPGYCCFRSYKKHSNILQNVGMFTDDRKAYRKNIQNIIAVLSGKKKRVMMELRRAMKEAAGRQDFEKAAKIRDRIEGLENVFAHSPHLSSLTGGEELKEGDSWHKTERFIRQLLGIKKSISRVEGYDISNISGTEATGSMVVFMDGRPAKTEYRKFRIKTVKGANDVAMLKEVIRRRLTHTGWPHPDLMLIDGGRAQLNAAIAAFADSSRQGQRRQQQTIGPQLSASNQRGSAAAIAIAALAKREEELYTQKRTSPVPLKKTPREVMHFFQRVRDESHRFAKKYHHKLREKMYRKA